jgi:hypothetical protein
MDSPQLAYKFYLYSMPIYWQITVCHVSLARIANSSGMFFYLYSMSVGSLSSCLLGQNSQQLRNVLFELHVDRQPVVE